MRFAPDRRKIDRIDDSGQPLDQEMDKLAAAYVEPDWPTTGTIKDIINRQLSSANDGCAVT